MNLLKEGGKRLISAFLAATFLFSLGHVSAAAYGTESDEELHFSAKEQLMESLGESESRAESSGAEYDGYIFALDENAPAVFSTLEDSPVSEVQFADNMYTAESVDQIFEFADAEYIQYIEPNYIVELFDDDMEAYSASEPNDQYYRDGSQWNLDVLNVPFAWEYGLEGSSISDDKSVVIAVIDSGLNAAHQDIDETRVLEGYSYVTTDTSDTGDTLGHGTFCSGQIFARKDNEVGISGIVPEVYIMPLRVFGSSNRAYTSDIVSAINYATASGVVDVISMSLGGEGSTNSMKLACENAVNNGILVVAAAGNDGNSTLNYPAAYDCVVGVGSVGTDASHYEISDFSQRGMTNVFCVAPGYKLVSTYYTSTTAYYRGSGTSFACPEVAALGAVVKSIDRSINQTEFMELIKTTSTDLGDKGRDSIYGYGLVDFKAVIEALINTEGDESNVTVRVQNENGDEIKNAKVVITKYGDDAEIAPDKTGSYDLEKGRYSYTVSADRYETATGVFSVISGSRTLRITLEGLRYPVVISPLNTKGEPLADAYIVVKNAKEAVQNADEDGRYRLKNGGYTYSISATGYYTQTGAFTVADDSMSLDVTVYGDIDVASTDIRTVNADGEAVTGITVELKNSQGGIVEPYSDGYYKLYPGSYTYTAYSNSYKTETGELVITDAQKGTLYTFNIEMLNPIVWVYFEVIPISAAVTVRNSAGEVEEPVAPGEYKLLKGDYTYSAAADGYVTATGSFTITTAGMTIDLELLSAEDDGFASVVFISNGGTSVEAVRAEKGRRIARPDDPNKTGYEFGGWYKEPSLTTEWNFDVDIVTSDTSLYAKWTPKTYRMIYMFGDTELTGLEPSTHTFGTAVKQLPAPVIDGYRFMYWCADPELTNRVTGVSAAKASDAVFYAYCEKDDGSYDVRFDSNGGSDVPAATANADSGYLVQKPADPEKPGYTFSGWYSDEELTELWNFDTDRVEWHMTLYAGWTANTYAITYIDRGNTLSDLAPAAYTFGEAVFELPRLERQDAVFAGWYSDADCTQRVRSIPSGMLGDLTLYAGWTDVRDSVPEDRDYEPDDEGNLPTVDADGYTLIYTQEQLAALSEYSYTSAQAREKIASGDIPRFRLAQSILLTGEWTPLGRGGKYLCVEFDGAGHTIAGLFINSTGSHVSLFGDVYGTEIRNLSVYGSVKGTSFVAGLVSEGYSTGIYGCTVDVSVLSNGKSAGGIAATMSTGTIENCANLGSVSCTGSNDYNTCIYAVGGILGNETFSSGSSVVISGCYNTGEITNSSGTPTGGIVGFVSGADSIIKNSYNTGAITQSGTKNAYFGSAAGIIGFIQGGGSIYNCYSAGALTSSQFTAGVAAFRSVPDTSMVYFLSGASPQGGYYIPDEYERRPVEIASEFDYSPEFDYSVMLSGLGAAFAADSGRINQGYPVLAWQITDEYAVTLAVHDSITDEPIDGAEITVDGKSFSGAGVLKMGLHTCTVAKAGYETLDSVFYVGIGGAELKAQLNAKKYTYVFRVSPADADFTLENETLGAIEPTKTETDGDCRAYTFELARSAIYGKYAYSAAKYGYITASGDISVNGAGTTTVEMTEGEMQNVVFEVIPDTAVIEVTASDGTVMSPAEGTTYRLAEGAYSYAVRAEGYYTERGTLTIPGMTTVVTIVMRPNTGWDGTSDTEWYSDSASTYYISTGEQLAGLRDLCNAGNTFSGKTIILTKDISLSDRPWTPIGIYDYSDETGFLGTFDGAGHTVSGLNVKMSGASYKNAAGLFGTVSKATIKNLTVEGSVSGNQCVGGIAGISKGSRFYDCTSNVTVSAVGYGVGGIVGNSFSSASVFERCVNNGSVTTTSENVGVAAYAIGGILGVSSTGDTIVRQCVNNGAITGSVQSVGGIVGAMGSNSTYPAPTVESCLNNGDVVNPSLNGCAGGIFGGSMSRNEGIIKYCVSLGTVTCGNEADAGGIYAGSMADVSVVRCYYLYNTAERGIAGREDVEDQAEKFGSESDNGYDFVVNNLDDYAIKDGKLALKWQDGESSYTVWLKVGYDTSANRSANDRASFLVRDYGTDLGEEYLVSSDGRVDLKNGTYYYAVGQRGYEDATGTFTVSGGEATVSIRLKASRYSLSVDYTPEDAALSLVNSTGTVVEPESSSAGKTLYRLYNGKYSYTLKCYGYETKSGDITVSYGDAEVSETLEKLSDYDVSFSVSSEKGEVTEDTTIWIYQNGDMVKKLSGRNVSTKLAAGEYTYIVRSQGFASASGKLEVSESTTVSVALVLPNEGAAEPDTFWYLTDPSQESFTISTADELFGLAELVNTGVTEFEGKTVYLGDDIDLTGSGWTPIGKWDGNRFKGCFIGNGHSITFKNGEIAGSEVSFGLFGYLENAVVTDLVLRGTTAIRHSSEQSSAVIVYVGALAGFADNTTVERVSNQMNISVEASVGSACVLDVGGLIGWADGCTISSCSSIGPVTAAVSTLGLGSNNVCVAYVGGIAGYAVSMADGAVTILNCYNTARITANAPNTARAAGIVATVNSSGASFRMENCYDAGRSTANGSNGNALCASASLSGTAVNNYFLSSLTSELGAAKTDEELRSESMVKALGSAYSYSEGAYPKLAWEKSVASIAAATMPDKLVYDDLESFDDSGLTLKVSYDDGTSEIITSGWSVEDADVLRVDRDGETDKTSVQTSIKVEFKGAYTLIPITVRQTQHLIDNSALGFDIPAPKTGERAKTLTFETDTYTAAVSWTKAGESFTGTFEDHTFYRAELTVTAKYADGSIWNVFDQKSAAQCENAYETLYKRVCAGEGAGTSLTVLTTVFTFKATGENADITEKALHLYYEGDDNKAEFDAGEILDSTVSISVGNEKAELSVRELELLALTGGMELEYTCFDGSIRVNSVLTGIPLYEVLSSTGLFASNLSDDTTVRIGSAEYTYRQIRAKGYSYDASGVMTRGNVPAILSFAVNGAAGSGANGSIQAVRPMYAPDDNNAAQWARGVQAVSVEAPEYVTAFSVDFDVASEDGAKLTGVSIRVMDEYGNEVPAANGSYELNEGCVYSYEVGADGYGTVCGKTGVIAGKTVIPVTLVKVWDGKTLKEPELSDGVYLIYTAEELMWFNRNAGKTASARLMADITLNSDNSFVNKWEPMNTSETRDGAFAGEFDGNGHTIYNLYIEVENEYIIIVSVNGTPMLMSDRLDNASMFGYLSGTVRDLGVTGQIRVLDRPDSSMASWMQIGGIAGYVSGGTISGCYTDIDVVYEVGKETSVTAGYPDCGFPELCDVYIGGIAGSIYRGTIENCYSTGSVYAEGTRRISAGGILGGMRSADASVRYCYSTSDISVLPSDMSSSSANFGVGGIVGDAAASYSDGGRIEGCFALNSVLDGGNSLRSSINRVVGSNGESAALKNNYGNEAMSIVNFESHDDESFIRGSVNGANVNLVRARKDLVPYTNVGWDTGIWKSDDTMTLPTFYWQRSGADVITYAVSVAAEAADVSFTGGVAGSEGSYTTTNLSTISFTVSADAGRRVERVTVSGGELSSAGGYYTVRNITGPVVITVSTVVGYGDVNGDGYVNAVDAMLVMRYAAGLRTLDAQQLEAADVDGDGSVNSADAGLILKYSVGLLAAFPVENK